MKKSLLIISLFVFIGLSKAQVKSLDPIIVQALSQVSEDSIESHINDIIQFHTRHNLSTQTDPKIGLGAAMRFLEKRCNQWAKKSKNRPKPVVELQTYKAGGENQRIGKELELPNLVVTLPGTAADGEIVLMAHVDSQVNDNYDGTTYAPGANDDGSGVACLLETVRILSQIPLRQTIKCFFVSGEEHGLYGATALAKKAKEQNWPILAVINNDMIGNSVASETGLSTIVW